MNNFLLLKQDWQDSSKGKRVVVGFDGFIDTITRPIRNGSIGNDPNYFNTMNEFGCFIVDRSGKSASIELESIEERIGGNAPNFAAGLLALNVETRIVGTLGYPTLHPLFREIFEPSAVLTTANPGQSISYEFDDGKLMCALNRDVNTLDWATMKNRLGIAALELFYKDCTLSAFVNWSEMMHAQQLWEGVLEHIFEKTHFPEWMFFDLSDCARKTTDELRQVARLMRQCASKSKLVLSLNENEKKAFCKALLDTENISGDVLLTTLDAYAVVFHYLSHTHAFDRTATYTFQNHFVEKPRISTGGGDNFNAGLCAGLLSGYSLEQSAMIGSLCGSYYVEYGHCASFKALNNYRKKL